MPRTDRRMRIEYVLRQGNSPLYEQSREFALTEYVVGSKAHIDGELILGLQMPEDGQKTYQLHRRRSAISFDFDDDDEQKVDRRFLKMIWNDPTGVQQPVVIWYPIRLDLLHNDIPDSAPDIRWKFQLRQATVGGNLVFRAVHVRDSGAGFVSPCQVLRDKGIDCNASNLSNANEARCEEANCIGS